MEPGDAAQKTTKRQTLKKSIDSCRLIDKKSEFLLIAAVCGSFNLHLLALVLCVRVWL